jgi:hypothetical protein
MTTMGRNISAGTAAILGLCLLVLPALQGVPLPNVAFFSVVGLLLIFTFVYSCVLWRPTVGRAKRAARAAEASGVFVFMQAELTRDSAAESQYPGSGWVMFSGDQLIITIQGMFVLVAGSTSVLTRPVSELSAVARREGTSMSYAMVVLEFAGRGEEFAFILAPANGSGLRGPSDEEIARVIADVRSRIVI